METEKKTPEEEKKPDAPTLEQKDDKPEEKADKPFLIYSHG